MESRLRFVFMTDCVEFELYNTYEVVYSRLQNRHHTIVQYCTVTVIAILGTAGGHGQ